MPVLKEHLRTGNIRELIIKQSRKRCFKFGRFTLCRVFDCLSFDPMSFDPMAFDPMSFDPMAFDPGRFTLCRRIVGSLIIGR